MDKAVIDCMNDADFHDQIKILTYCANHFENESRSCMKNLIDEDKLPTIRTNGYRLIRIFEEMIQDRIKRLEMR